MDATEARRISDQANGIDEDKLDGDFDHIEIEISEAANNGHYSMDYDFNPDKSFGEVNAHKNRLKSAGFDVEIIKKGNSYSLSIDWSND